MKNRNSSVKMKLQIVTLFMAIFVSQIVAFAPQCQKPSFIHDSELSMVQTGRRGKPAKSAEEDLELTIQVVLNGISTPSKRNWSTRAFLKRLIRSVLFMRN